MDNVRVLLKGKWLKEGKEGKRGFRKNKHLGGGGGGGFQRNNKGRDPFSCKSRGSITSNCGGGGGGGGGLKMKGNGGFSSLRFFQ